MWFLRKFCQFSSPSPTEDEATEKSKVEVVELIFYIVSQNLVVFVYLKKSSPILAQCRSTNSWPSLGTSNNWCCAHIHDTAISWFSGVLVCFLTYLMRSSVGTWGNSPKIIRTKNLYLYVISGENLRSIICQCVLSVLLYLWGAKISFFGNWIEVVILAAMGQYIFLILSFCTSLFFCFVLLLLLFLFCFF